MNVEKKVLGHLEKCYSIAPLVYNGEDCFLVAAEKVNRCILFDSDGNEKETVWSEPGGVMSMVQVPDTNAQFLATHKFYSPNDGAAAYIAIITSGGNGTWARRKLVDLPFVHRFDILTRNGKRYLIACTLKSAHEYKDDWRTPGKIYGALLPDDLSAFDEHNQLQLSVIQDGFLRNHGYYRNDDGESAVVSAANGIFTVRAPEDERSSWTLTQLSPLSASDAVLLDLDGDGKKELAAFSPFHGDTFSILKENGGTYETAYTCPEKLAFLHALYGGMLCSKPRVVVGHRGGKRNLVAYAYDAAAGSYTSEVIDADCGSAHVFHFVKDGEDIIISANREIDEIAMYTVTQ